MIAVNSLDGCFFEFQVRKIGFLFLFLKFSTFLGH